MIAYIHTNTKMKQDNNQNEKSQDCVNAVIDHPLLRISFKRKSFRTHSIMLMGEGLTVFPSEQVWQQESEPPSAQPELDGLS